MLVIFYNDEVKTWDVIVIGGGIIGLSLAIALRKRGTKVLVIERGEPGREASHAAGGMLVDCELETHPALRDLAAASARMYPEFARELELESGEKVDLRDQGTIFAPSESHRERFYDEKVSALRSDELASLEPQLVLDGRAAYFLNERSVDPRSLTYAAWQTAKRRGVDFSSGDLVKEVNVSDGLVSGVTTNKTAFVAEKVVNCAGAWSGQIPPIRFPTRPVKGQMLCLALPSRNLLQHVVRTPEVYLIPRSDGRLLVGATVEEAGFDKRTDGDTMQRLHHAALALVPELRNAKILENWAGLRPGTPDGLPILGATNLPGYFVATGHFRDGILLAPITAEVMADVVIGVEPEHDLAAFSPLRFANNS